MPITVLLHTTVLTSNTMNLEAKRSAPSKRQRSPTRLSSSTKKRRLYSTDGIVRDMTLRHVITKRGAENPKVLKKGQEIHFSRRSRELKDTVVLEYRQKKKEIHLLRRGKVQNVQRGQKARSTVRACSPRTVESVKSIQPQDEVQYNELTVLKDELTAWSDELTLKWQQMETNEVEQVVRDLVTRVEVNQLQDQITTLRMDLKWARWSYETAEKCLEKLENETYATQVFLAIEKQLLDDRVVELETQLAQKRAVEKEKEMELATLRAAHDELVELNHVMPKEAYRCLVDNSTVMEAKVKHLNETVQYQTQQLAQREHERATLQQANDKLTRQVREQNIPPVSHHSDATLKMAEKVLETSKQRNQELKILYAKFSAAMDAVSDKTMRLEEMEEKVKDVETLRERNKELERQVQELEREKRNVFTVKDTMEAKMATVEVTVAEWTESKAQQKDEGVETCVRLVEKVTEKLADDRGVAKVSQVEACDSSVRALRCLK